MSPATTYDTEGSMNPLTIQNVVGGGDLGVEIDLCSVADIEFKHFDPQYEPKSFPGVVLRHIELNPTVMLYRSGKFNIAGGKSATETKEAFSSFCSEISDKTDLELHSSIEIRYYVTTGSLGRPVDLSAAAVILGANETEYEPEQFPGLFYRPSNQNWFVILFASGSIIVDGEPDMRVLQKAYEQVDEILQ